MLQFKAPNDLNNLPESHPAYPLVKALVARLIVDFPPGRSYDPEDDRWVVEHPYGPQAASPKLIELNPFKGTVGLLGLVVGHLIVEGTMTVWGLDHRLAQNRVFR